jgi:Protein of unknown function (DUF2510)
MMTTATLNDLIEAATVQELLFGGELAEPIDALAESLREHGTVKSLVNGFPGLTAAVEREVATEASALLSLNLLDLAVAGWQRYEALMGAARRTQDAPTTTEEIVALVTHRIESSHPVTVEVLVDGESIGTIEVKLNVAFDLAGVLAVVRQARLTAVRSGTCTVTGTLAMERTVVAQGQRGLDLPGAVQLRQGVALLEPAASAACVEPPVVGSGQSPSADWYPDPMRRYELRRWDGSRWTDHVATQGHVTSDPVPRP